jgi:hypothetical protein
MVNPPSGPDGDPRLGALTALAGWRQFASEMPAVPQLLDRKVWQSLDAGKRAAYDDDRIAHHSRLLIVQAPAVRDVVTTGRRLAHLNRSAHYGRSGLIVSGPARPGPGRRRRSPSSARPSRSSAAAATHAPAMTSRSSTSLSRPRPPPR